MAHVTFTYMTAEIRGGVKPGETIAVSQCLYRARDAALAINGESGVVFREPEAVYFCQVGS
ncbi:MAG: hypothetical protein KKB90_05555 [Actinobacteria bacterium]|nr:hypothetical protein [Actinomycetota bacterium]MCG2818171.1 hypothetical protein [Actinomycetes bacterium]MBU4218413.1 hypothetical protein [Actinomycetota bacterium]MBU4358496.1 hypothetical protein [Actinomycetota bacterium]MBU4401636.1 hypothetical protein [Actinomycetota bacterium]